MSIQNEEEIEEILYEAHSLGLHREVLDRALAIMSNGVDRCTAYHLAIKEIKIEHEIHGE